MDLQAAYLLNGKSWLWAKLAAFACFAIAGALLIASLTAGKASLAKASVTKDTNVQLSHYSAAALPLSPAKR